MTHLIFPNLLGLKVRMMYDEIITSSKPFYLRRSSGEKLCPKCLEKSLIKHIKRSFRGIKSIKPGSTLCVFVPPGKVLEGTALHIILSHIEKNYGSSVTSFFPNCFRKASSKILEIISGLSNSVILYYNKEMYNFPSLLELINYSINTATNHCNKSRIKLPMLLPFTLTDIVEGFIDSMVFQEGSDGRSLFNDLLSNVKYLLPFKGIVRSDILAYAYGKGFLEALNLCPITIADGARQISDAIAEIEVNHSELLYSTLKSIKQLINVIN